MSFTSPPDQKLHQATESLRAVAHPIRIQIIQLLHQSDGLSVKEIHETLDVQQPVASHHLRILKDKKIVNSIRKGQLTIYELIDARFGQLLDLTLDILG